MPVVSNPIVTSDESMSGLRRPVPDDEIGGCPTPVSQSGSLPSSFIGGLVTPPLSTSAPPDAGVPPPPPSDVPTN